MKTTVLFIFCAMIIVVQSCRKETPAPLLKMPNSDFEGWSAGDDLQAWKTNSCPECYPAFNTYVVQKTTEAYHGQYAAKFLFNGVYPATANNTFRVPLHPNDLVGYVKCGLSEHDTVSIKVRVFNGNTVVDSGEWVNTESIAQYKKFRIDITQNSTKADSVTVSVRGGNKASPPGNGSVLWVDYLCIH